MALREAGHRNPDTNGGALAAAEGIEKALAAMRLQTARNIDGAVGRADRAVADTAGRVALSSGICSSKQRLLQRFAAADLLLSPGEGEAFRGFLASVCCRFPAKAAKRLRSAPAGEAL
ncbi:MAG: hypothetical protein JO162_13595 [Alphaproteobacteria bacterium]|nr:hypothetical protein [Alphaproteobacteria bacterium]MBV9584996.1 hypothetical protein [Alphaproteobacteria bacterium]MBV9966797.1 hypothetical protein [Alphaproteobacteria bacterium]